MAEEKVKVLDIDKDNIFVNPFMDVEPVDESYAMYEKYLECPPNRKILEKIGNNDIISRDYESFGTTRAEVLQRLACKYNYRNRLTVVRRDIMKNLYGIIVQQVNCDGEMGDDIARSIKLHYYEVEGIYKELKVKYPGGIQLFKVVDGKQPLWICNLFGKKKEEDSSIFLKNYDFLKRGFAKLRVQIRKNHIENLPIYVPYNMGGFQGWDWKEYEPIIMKYLPQTVVCMK